MEKPCFFATIAVLALLSAPALAEVRDPARIISPTERCAAPMLTEALRQAPAEAAPPPFQLTVHACVVTQASGTPQRPIRKT